MLAVLSVMVYLQDNVEGINCDHCRHAYLTSTVGGGLMDIQCWPY